MTITLHEGDSYQVLRSLGEKGVKFASCVTDPPYGLVSIVKRFGKSDAKAAKHGTDGAFARSSAGFMGHGWDAKGVERDPEFWKLVFDLILPGGYIVAFSSARTYHHMAVAIESAGFITHPMIGWTYASGLPKGHHTHVEGQEGWRHGGQARKPALEPIYVGQKPFTETSCTRNIKKHGVGAVNIDGIRVYRGENEEAGYPSNLITDGSPEVDRLFPAADGQRGASSTAVRKNAVYKPMTANKRVLLPRKDTGSAMRFFESYRYLCEDCQDLGWTVVGQCETNSNGEQQSCDTCQGQSAWHPPFDGEPLVYHRKANREDRNGSEHATVKPIGLMRSLVRHVTPPGHATLDPFAGTGTTGIAAELEGVDSVLIEAEPSYCEDIRHRILELTPSGAAYLKSLGLEPR